MPKVIAFVTYEGPWFRCGGIAAVMDRLPAAVRSVSSFPTIVITPFHRSTHQDNRILSLSMTPLREGVSVRYDTTDIPVTVYRYSDKDVFWYFLKAGGVPVSEEPFFTGIRHPYDLGSPILVRDSIFFGQAVVEALRVIAPDILGQSGEVEWRLVLQDWEAATTALAFASQDVYKGLLYLTLHNSYDEYAPPTDEPDLDRNLKMARLSRVSINSQLPGDTILDHAFGLVQWPVFTVSQEFANEFTEDLLEREIMAKHLQPVLQSKRILGIDNGPFKDLVVERNLLNQAAYGAFASLQQWKANQRAKALEELAKPLPSSVHHWGDPGKFRQDNSPWVVMAGRDDPRQKGYDIAAAAVEDYLTLWRGKPSHAQFLFFPIPGDEGEQGLAFLEKLAVQFPEDVLVFLGRWTAGFSSTLRGAAYGLMPSLYEPFGMANEFYLDGGCVCIGRATGGNLEQIVPLRASSTFSLAVHGRANRYHSLSAHPTGILFREKDDIYSASKDWAGINAAQYDKQGGSPTRVEQRQQYPVFQEMVSELRIAIEDSIRIYIQEPELYYRMLAEGVAHIQRTFSWHRAAQEYVRHV